MSLRMVGSLMAVLGLILLLFYLAKRLRLRRSSGFSQVPEMCLLGTLTLAPKRALALVEFSGQWLIVGVGTESVTLISSMEKPPAAEEHGRAAAQKGKTFQELFAMTGLLHPWRNHGTSRKDGAA
jgi:flagellar biosynthetic protein FliO